jgi:uncharacterized lipoprotein YajG
MVIEFRWVPILNEWCDMTSEDSFIKILLIIAASVVLTSCGQHGPAPSSTNQNARAVLYSVGEAKNADDFD